MSLILRIIVMIALCVLSMATGAMAATQQQIDDARAKGLAWLLLNQSGEGSWKSAAGLEVQTTAAALTALKNAGIRKGFSYGAAVAWLQNSDPASVDSLSRKIAALSDTGVNVHPELNRLLTYKNHSARALWGAYDKYETSFPDTPLAMGAVRTGNSSNYLSAFINEVGNAIYCVIFPAQLSGGSWSYVAPVATTPASMTGGAVIPTAYNIIELQAAKNANIDWGIKSYGCGGTSYYLPAQINNAVNWLLTNKKNADNGFSDSGQSTILETALVYQALVAMGSTDPAKDAALDYLIGLQDTLTGSWAGGDAFQTAMALQTLSSVALADTISHLKNDFSEKAVMPNKPAVGALSSGHPEKFENSGFPSARE